MLFSCLLNKATCAHLTAVTLAIESYSKSRACTGSVQVGIQDYTVLVIFCLPAALALQQTADLAARLSRIERPRL